MARTTDNPWLARYALLTASATLVLICFGGLVTSHGAGMAVPDWPNTFGYSMFFFPISKWVGGIFYEHTHRLWASLVGVMVVALTRWLGGRKSRGPLAAIGLLEVLAGFAIILVWPNLKGTGHFLTGVGGVVLMAALVWVRNEPAREPLPQLGWLAFWLVQIQGLLGGLRVVLFKDEIGIFHAALGQLFFVLTCAIALLTSAWWSKASALKSAPACGVGLRRLFLLTTMLIFGQLVLGATMRHQHAGLAIPDFPAAYGRLWPMLDPESISRYNQHRAEANAVNPITAFQIVLQMAHRFIALAILTLVAWSAWLAHRRLGRHPLVTISFAWLGLIVVQVFLGAATIWTGKSADIATAHVAVGALSLMTGTILVMTALCCLVPTAKRAATIPAKTTSFASQTGLSSSAQGWNP